jgi:hypothetical protein
VVPETSPLEQSLGDGRGPVAESHEPNPEAAQRAEAFRDVEMYLEH